VGDDFLPDIAMGRLPVRTTAQLDRLVSRIEAYEAMTASDAWARRMLWVGDDDILQRGDECGEPGSVGLLMDTWIEDYIASSPDYDPAHMLKAYFGNFADTSATRAFISDSVNTPPPGSGFMFFYGHGSEAFVGVHCTLGGGTVIDKPYVSTWTNAVELPLFMTSTCNAGDFEYVDHQRGDTPYSICEHAVLAPGGGAIAAVSNTSNVRTNEGASLGRGFIAGLFADGELPPFLPPSVPEAEARRIVGALAYASYVQLFADFMSSAVDGVQTSTILGDPAVRLRIYPY